MEIKSHRKVTVAITLDEDEATWLMGFIQNYPYEAEEPEKDLLYRYDLFNSIKDQLNV